MASERTGRMYYDLTLTNKEVHIMFANMVQDWFAWNDDYNDYITSYLPKPLSLLDVITYLSSSSTISPNTNPW